MKYILLLQLNPTQTEHFMDKYGMPFVFLLLVLMFLMVILKYAYKFVLDYIQTLKDGTNERKEDMRIVISAQKEIAVALANLTDAIKDMRRDSASFQNKLNEVDCINYRSKKQS